MSKLIRVGLFILIAGICLLLLPGMEVSAYNGDGRDDDRGRGPGRHHRRPQVDRVSLYTNSIRGGEWTKGTVDIKYEAPPNGAKIELKSDDSSVSVPDRIEVPDGTKWQYFDIKTYKVQKDTTVRITAKAGGTEAYATLTVLAAPQ